MIRIVRAICLNLIFVSSVSFANYWTPLIFSHNINDQWMTNIELQPRFSDSLALRRLFIRPAVGRRMNKHLNLWLGYALIQNHLPNSGIVNYEHRPFAHAVYTYPIRKLTLSTRTRFEYRVLPTMNPAVIRWRQLFGVRVSLTKHFYWRNNIEFLTNFNGIPDSRFKRGLEQIRVGTGLGLVVNKHATFDVGYLNQRFVNRTPVLVNHIWVTGITLR